MVIGNPQRAFEGNRPLSKETHIWGFSAMFISGGLLARQNVDASNVALQLDC